MKYNKQMKYIIRVDKTNSWLVANLITDSGSHSTTFKDNKYGGKEKALEAAIKLRDYLLSKGARVVHRYCHRKISEYKYIYREAKNNAFILKIDRKNLKLIERFIINEYENEDKALIAIIARRNELLGCDPDELNKSNETRSEIKTSNLKTRPCHEGSLCPGYAECSGRICYADEHGKKITDRRWDYEIYGDKCRSLAEQKSLFSNKSDTTKRLACVLSTIEIKERLRRMAGNE